MEKESARVAAKDEEWQHREILVDEKGERWIQDRSDRALERRSEGRKSRMTYVRIGPSGGSMTRKRKWLPLSPPLFFLLLLNRFRFSFGSRVT